MASSLLVMSDISSTGSSSTSGRCSSASRPIVNRRGPTPAAAVDFSAYLLSASPPGFELSPGVFSCGLPPSQRFTTSAYTNSSFQKWKWSSSTSSSSSPTTPEWSTCGLESTLACSSPSSSDSDCELVSPLPSSLSASRHSSAGAPSSGSLTKKVSFADDLGKMLEQIRVFNESSDTPPHISPKVLRRHASVDSLMLTSTPLRRSFRVEALHRSTSSPAIGQEMVAVPRLTPNFSMPSADRAAYLERIDLACVSLESVHVLPVETRPTGSSIGGGGYGAPPVVDRLVGSIGVRNMAFEKSVNVRCTFDGWVSYVNVKAVYSRSERASRVSAPGKGELHFDVFDFSVNLPVRWRTATGGGRRVELAVRYDVAGQTFWDNNEGRNYELVSTDVEDHSSARSSGFLDHEDDPNSRCWTEFSGWSDVDATCPYW